MMENYVMVNYSSSSNGTVKINYRIEEEGKMQNIDCVVEKGQNLPKWLQLDRFNFVAMKVENIYSLLFNESKYNKNLETVLFMDKVFAQIMDDKSLPIS